MTVSLSVDSPTPEPGSCDTCPEVAAGDTSPMDACPMSQRECGHHCNHIWDQDCCHWCGGEFIQGEDYSVAWVSPHGPAVQVS